MEENISLKFKLFFKKELLVFFQFSIGLVTEKESNISFKEKKTKPQASKAPWYNGLYILWFS